MSLWKWSRVRVLTAENGRAGQPANQKGNEIKISFSDTMYTST